MAVYYNLVFVILIIEMAFFTLLSLPFPRKVRKLILNTFKIPFQNVQFQIGLKFIFGFILILFVDSINRVISITNELLSIGSSQTNPAAVAAGLLSDRSEVQARKFYAQRNMYLCGFTLFLTLIITRTYSLVDELTLTKDKLDHIKADGSDTGASAELQAELSSKDQDLEILKDQVKKLSEGGETTNLSSTSGVTASGIDSGETIDLRERKF